MKRRHFIAAIVPAALVAAPAPDETVYLLTYDHGGLVLWGMDHFSKYLNQAVEWLDRYPSFKIGLDNEAYTYDFMAAENPKMLEDLRGLLKRYKGRLGIGTCTYGQPLSQFINEESNIRQIGYALESDRKHLGTAPPVYIMSEHAMHSQIPQIIRGFGFQGAIMRTHFMMYGYNPTFDEAIGWWVGVDGSRIPTVPTYKGQGAEFGRTTMDTWILTRYPSEQSKESLDDFRKKFAHIKPLLASRADDSSLRREELVRRYEGRPGFRWILLEELLPSFPAPTAEMKTGPNDFAVRMPWGYCGNEIWNRSRLAETGVLTAERLAAAEALLGGASRESGLREAWKNLLVAQHHDIQITGILKDARRFLGASLAASERVQDASLRYAAGRMKGGSAGQVTVFNPSSWPRREWVEVDLPAAAGGKAFTARHAGKRTPCVPLPARPAEGGGAGKARVAILAEAPPLGFASYALEPAIGTAAPRTGVELDRASLRITTPFWSIRLHPEGGIAELESRRGGKPVFAAGRRSAFFAGRIEGKECESAGRWQLEAGPQGAPWAVAREEGLIGGIPYRMEMLVREDSPRLDFRVSFLFKNERIGVLSENKRDSKSGFVHEEKLRFKMYPVAGAGATGVRDLPFAIAETGDRYVEGNYWTAVASAGGGIAVFNRGTMGSVREADGGFSVPLAHAMYYIWGTRMLTGDFSYEFALHPFEGPWPSADLHRRAIEYNFPFAAAATAAGDGKLGDEIRLIEAASEDALVSALYPEGGAIYLRLHEHRGKRSQARLRYLRGRARLTEVDLAGKAMGTLRPQLAFRPWQIRTVRIDPGK